MTAFGREWCVRSILSLSLYRPAALKIARGSRSFRNRRRSTHRRLPTFCAAITWKRNGGNGRNERAGRENICREGTPPADARASAVSRKRGDRDSIETN